MTKTLTRYNILKMLAIAVIMILYSIYFSSLDIKNNVNIISFFREADQDGYLWDIGVLELFIPYLISILFISSIYKIYEENIYEMSVYLNTSYFNMDMLKNYIYYISLSFLFYLISILILYSDDISTLKIFFMIVFRLFTPVIYLIGIGIFAMAYTKNIIISLVIISVIVATDLFSKGGMLNYFCLTVSSRHIATLEKFILARVTILIVGLTTSYLGLRRATRY